MMMDTTIRLLLIDDDEDDYILTNELISEIETLHFKVEWVSSFDQAKATINERSHDVYLIDYRLGAHDGLELLKYAIENGCTKPIIMLTGKGDYKIDVEAMKSGASDYLVKGTLDPLKLERSIRYAVDRSQTLEALHESEKKYRTLFEQSVDAIYITDKEGNLIDVNQSMLKIFGYEREEMLELNIGDLFGRNQDYEKFIEEIRQRRIVKDFETTLVDKNDIHHICLITSNLQIINNLDQEGFQGLIHDITLRKRAEQELMNAEKLAFTGRIASSIAHEVRNPLTNVHLALENLRQDGEDIENFDMYLGIIERNSKRINQLITELLNSAKPADLKVQEYKIGSLVDETLELAIDRMKLRGIELEKNYKDEDVKVKVDPEKIKRALLNIIINAVEAMKPHDGKLVVTITKDNVYSIVKIKDNGIGISDENLKKLFDPFFSAKEGGVGLGLTTTQNVLSLHKGAIDVESEIGKGTEFSVKIPINSLV